MDGFTRVIEQKYFVVDKFEIAAGATVSLADVTGVSGCVVCLKGAGTVNSGRRRAVALGALARRWWCRLLPRALKVEGGRSALTFFRCFEPRGGVALRIASDFTLAWLLWQRWLSQLLVCRRRIL